MGKSHSSFYKNPMPKGDVLYINRKLLDVDFDMPVDVAGVRFRNPFIVASGPTTMYVEQLKRAAECGWAGASCKLTFDPPPYINRRPRYGWDKEQHLLYFSAEKRLNLDEACRLVEQARKEIDNFVLFSNFTYSEEGVEGWVNMAKQFENAGAHLNELNMCCPNMSFNVELADDAGAAKRHTGASQGQDPEALRNIITAIKANTTIPLCVKLTPEGSRQHQIAKICYDAGAEMVCGVANRLALSAIRMDQPGKSDIYLQEEQGMYCMTSRWLKPLALRDVYMMRKMVGPDPILIGTGGVTTWQDAVEMILAGADLVGVCAATVLYGFGFFPEFFQGFRNYFEERGIKDPRAIRDNLIEHVTTAPDLTLYEGYAQLKDRNLSAPCNDACPFHVPAQAYVRLVAQERFQEAFEQISSKNPLQHICGYVCNYPCEGACTRGVKDDPIRIRAIKRFVMDMARREGWKRNVEMQPGHGAKVGIIGSGPAGLTAASELAKAGYEVVVFEREEKAGGMLRYGIPEFRLPRELLDDEIDSLVEMGVTFRCNSRLGASMTLDDLRADGFKGFVATVGAQAGHTLGVPGESPDLRQYYTAIDFLKEHHRGNRLEVGERVVVVGGGFTAVDAARVCVRRGAKEVYMVYRRTRDEMTSVPEEVFEAEEEGVRVMYLVAPVEVQSANGAITGLRMRNNVLGIAAEAGSRRPPEPVPGAEFTIACDSIIVAVSQRVDDDIRQLDLATTRFGTLEHESATGATPQGDVVAAGDSAMGPATVIRSIAQGYNAAATLDQKLRGAEAVLKHLPETHPVEPRTVIDRNPDFKLQSRVEIKMRDAETRKKSFALYEETLTREAAVQEASRCLFCGCGVGCQICESLCLTAAWGHEGSYVKIDAEKCVACGICLHRCPNQNIEMVSTVLSPRNSSEAGKVKLVDDPAKVKLWDFES